MDAARALEAAGYTRLASVEGGTQRWQDEGRVGHVLFLNMSLWIMNPAESSPWFHIKSLHPHAIDILRHFGGDIEAGGFDRLEDVQAWFRTSGDAAERQRLIDIATRESTQAMANELLGSRSSARSAVSIAR